MQRTLTNKVAMIRGQHWRRALLLRISSSRHFLSRYPLKTPAPTQIASRLSSFSLSSSREYAQRTGDESPSQKPDSIKESNILEKFKLRQLRGSSTPNGQARPTQKESHSKSPEESEFREVKAEDDEKTVVWGFEQLGMDSVEVKEAMEEMGVFVPSEIQCIGIPRILEGKSLVLSSPSGSGRTLAYLLPLLQLMSRHHHHGTTGAMSWHPQAIVLCATEELSDQVFQMAKFIHGYTKKKSEMEGEGEKLTDAPIGMLVGTPVEILEQIQEGYMATDSLKYLVLDDADSMLASGFSLEIRGIINTTKQNELQTIMVTSELTKLLDKTYMEKFESGAGKVTAMFLEMEVSELFQLTLSIEALTNGVREAMDSLSLATDSTPRFGK